MAPVKLYGATLSWNVTRCVAALEEAGVEYEIVPINFGTGEHKSPEHLARNVSSTLTAVRARRQVSSIIAIRFLEEPFPSMSL
jgi:glutathione S-transferase